MKFLGLLLIVPSLISAQSHLAFKQDTSKQPPEFYEGGYSFNPVGDLYSFWILKRKGKLEFAQHKWISQKYRAYGSWRYDDNKLIFNKSAADSSLTFSPHAFIWEMPSETAKDKKNNPRIYRHTIVVLQPQGQSLSANAILISLNGYIQAKYTGEEILGQDDRALNTFSEIEELSYKFMREQNLPFEVRRSIFYRRR